jgi:hypothetical protein
MAVVEGVQETAVADPFLLFHQHPVHQGNWLNRATLPNSVAEW